MYAAPEMNWKGRIARTTVLLTMSSLLYPSYAQDNPEISRGTINVVVGNSHGMVVVTDSKQTLTDQNGKRVGSKEAQKLFQLDDRSACAIAGFGSGTVPALPQFGVEILGLLAQYRDELSKQRSATPFAIKLTTISHLVRLHLSALANVRAAIYPAPGANPYVFSLFLVGYDTDDMAKIGVLEIYGQDQVEQDGSYNWFFDDRIKILPVGPQLITRLGGTWAAAQQVVSQPQRYRSHAAVQKYVKSMQADSGASLELQDLQLWAQFLADESSCKHPLEIGGEKQVYVFSNGKIESRQTPSFPEPSRPFRFNLMQNSILDGHRLEFPSTIRFLHVRNLITNDRFLRLDNNFFVASEIRDSVLWYDGGETFLDKTNRMINCQLALGPNADPESNAVRAVVKQFQSINQSTR